VSEAAGSSGRGEPIVESNGQPAGSSEALRQRVRQQEILAQLGVKALQGAAVGELFDEAARLVAEGFEAEFSKVLEYLPAENRLLVRAGVGWAPGVVGAATIGADIASPAGFALRSGKPVISNHLKDEQRFRTPELLVQHGIRRAMNVILQGEGRPYGVLEVDSRSSRDFEEQDLAFLQGAANILGMAIDRDRSQRSLGNALARQRVLMREMDHRIKNSLSLVASMLHLQAREAEDQAVGLHLDEAASRVRAIARAHEQLRHDTRVEVLDVGRYIESVCRDLDESISQCRIESTCETDIEVSTDRAVSAALIVNELVANAAKYACRNTADSRIIVTLDRDGSQRFAISVRDFGHGAAEDADLNTAKGLGKRLIGLLVRQLDGALAIYSREPGMEVAVSIPVQGAPAGNA